MLSASQESSRPLFQVVNSHSDQEQVLNLLEDSNAKGLVGTDAIVTGFICLQRA
jgi:hypothetical protein